MIWILIAMLALVAFVYPVIRIWGKRARKTVDEIQIPVSQGNVSVFMGNGGSIDIIPFSLDKMKRGKASDYPLRLTAPSSSSTIGQTVRRAMVLSNKETTLTSEQLMKSLGFYDWKDYSEGKKSVSVTCRDNQLIFNSTVRRRDGSYAFRVTGYEKVVPALISDESLGMMILDMMKVSRSV